MNDLQNPGQPLTGLAAMIICGITGMIASITDHIEFWVRAIPAVVAIISGIFAIRYYYYAGSKAKIESKLLKQSKSTNP